MTPMGDFKTRLEGSELHLHPLISPTQGSRQRPSPKQPQENEDHKRHIKARPPKRTRIAHTGADRTITRNNGQGQRHHHRTYSFAQNPLLTPKPTRHPHQPHHQNSLPSPPQDISLTSQAQPHLPRGQQHTYTYKRNPHSIQFLNHSHKPYPTPLHGSTPLST